MGTLSLICLLFSIYQTFGQLNSKEDALQATSVLDSTTSGKVSKVFRDILNQESLVRFSMVQKMQSLMLDVADSKINNEYMKKKLNDVTEELHAVHAKNRRMEQENARLHQELKTLNDQNNHSIQSLEILKNQTSRIQKENEGIAFDTTEIKKQLEEFNKTFGYLNMTNEEVKKDFQKNIQVLKKEVKENKNSNEAQHLRLDDVKTLLTEHIQNFNESRTVFQQQLEIMNKRMENLEKHDNLSTRIQTVEDNLQKFSLSVNDIRIQLQKIVTA
ncbi:dynactin subunit 1-like, partial [Saccostrea cucullata]|uniref:dynactin subunit 1-like n=1 Tax=Saccostrea cuccullata TaxID=36930 RepID=UPI002ED42AE7